MTAPIGELLGPEDVYLDVPADSREALLERAAALLAKRSGLADRRVYDQLVARERLGSTALGHGIALPHARIPGLARPYAALIRTRGGIEFDAPDRRPVHVFLVLLVPAESADRHLALMACAAQQFADREFRVKLKSAGGPGEIAGLFDYLPE